MDNRFVSTIINWLENLKTNTISINTLTNKDLNQYFTLTNVGYELLEEFDILCLFDETQVSSVHIPISEIDAISSTTFKESIVCGIGFKSREFTSLTLSAKQ